MKTPHRGSLYYNESGHILSSSVPASMRHLAVILIIVFLVTVLILNQTSILHNISILKYIATRLFNPIPVSQNKISSTSVTSQDKTREIQVTSTTLRYSKRISDRDFCTEEKYNTISEGPLYSRNQCPERPIVTASQIGRLGNQMWEYASVWTVARTIGHKPFIPSCLIETLNTVFKNLTAIPPLKYIEHCPIKFDQLWTSLFIEEAKDNIVLPVFAQLPQYLVPHLQEVLQLFQFHDHLAEKSQNILRRAANGVNDTTYVGVHVRRRDYRMYLKLFYDITVVSRDFFVRQMNYFRKKYSRVIFVILSDDPGWCERELSANDTVVVSGNSPEQDLSLMASCNHSILDYGTFGVWGALMAGGETLLYKLPSGMEMNIAKLMPKWHVVT